MKGLKTFFVSHEPTYADIKVQINFDFVFKHPCDSEMPMEEMLKEMVNFWSGGKTRLKENENNLVKTFLKQLCL